jgi:hypothetical protein
LADRDPRTLAARPIFQGAAENILDLRFIHAVAVDVGFFGPRVYVVADVHGSILRGHPGGSIRAREKWVADPVRLTHVTEH